MNKSPTLSKIFIVLGMMTLFSLIGFWFSYTTPESHQETTATIEIGSSVIHVETAVTEDEKKKGLSGRLSLPPGTGMVFLFPEPGVYGFWMKEMHFPIDIVWIFEEKIVAVERNLKPEPLEITPKTVYPPQPVTEVLEMNAGDARDFQKGDFVNFNRIKNQKSQAETKKK